MTTKTYAEIIRSADEMPAGLFAARWRLMPEAESIPGIDPADPDRTKEVLVQLHERITRPLADIRKAAGLSQQKLADRFAIPVATVRNWEQRDCCPIYMRLMMQEALGQWSPSADMGVQIDG